ncbi:hypothetical protein MKY48_32815 [Paenibacillus sp. FSL W8-0187]|uniref:hypothetical protein n=1 Tax=Paenibacillus TaxID=44249 RepID=UPI0030D72092
MNGWPLQLNASIHKNPLQRLQMFRCISDVSWLNLMLSAVSCSSVRIRTGYQEGGQPAEADVTGGDSGAAGRSSSCVRIRTSYQGGGQPAEADVTDPAAISSCKAGMFPL